MAVLRKKLFVLSIIFLFGFAPVGYSESGTLPEEAGKKEPKPIVIKSKVLEADNELKLVTFSGDVNVHADGFVLDCRKMLLYYGSFPEQKNTNVEIKINKIIATGHVKINRVKGGVATAEKAIYYQKDEKMILSGNPVVKQGNDFIEGDRIIIYLKENRSVVESSEDNTVRAIIFPKGKKRQDP